VARSPWHDWLPGVLSKNQIRVLTDEDRPYLDFGETPEVDYSAFDLHLTNDAWEVKTGSIKPNGGRYRKILDDRNLATQLTSKDDFFTLQVRSTYVFRLREKLLQSAELAAGEIFGQATAKSSIGRLDVLARLIVDGSSMYEGFICHDLMDSSGDMYVEVTPMTFPIAVRAGDSLNQLRLFYGAPESVIITGKALRQTVLVCENNAQENHGITLSVNLDPADVAGEPAVAFRADRETGENTLITLSSSEKPNPRSCWAKERKDESGRLRIQKQSFYIIRSDERLALPGGIAAYCRAIDETIGEMRIHYAGFVHPFFGRDRSDNEIGTPLIFEVRGHDVNVSLSQREVMARVLFYRMSEDATRDDDAATRTPYQQQTLQLSKYFADW